MLLYALPSSTLCSRSLRSPPTHCLRFVSASPTIRHKATGEATCCRSGPEVVFENAIAEDACQCTRRAKHGTKRKEKSTPTQLRVKETPTRNADGEKVLRALEMESQKKISNNMILSVKKNFGKILITRRRKTEDRHELLLRRAARSPLKILLHPRHTDAPREEIETRATATVCKLRRCCCRSWIDCSFF